MDDDRIESNFVQEWERMCELVEIIKNGTTDFYDRKLGGGGRRGKDAKITRNFTLSAYRIKQTSDCFLTKHQWICKVYKFNLLYQSGKLDDKLWTELLILLLSEGELDLGGET